MEESYKSKFIGKPKVFIPITILMIVLFFSVIIFICHYGISHAQSNSILNCGFSLLAMPITIILFLNVGMDKIRHPRTTSFFQLNCLVMFFIFLNDSICWLYKPDTNITIKYLLDSNVYFFDNIEIFCFRLYVESLLPEKDKFRKIFNGFLNFLFTLTMILVVTNPITDIFFYYVNGDYTRAPTFFICSIFIYLSLIFNFFEIFFYLKDSFKKRISLASVSLFTLIPIILHFSRYGLCLMDLGFFISLVLIYANVQVEERDELLTNKNQLNIVRTDVMMSQIQPHFLYNSLATISSLCDFDPMMAQNATDRFAAYLRLNLYSIRCKDNIPFTKELDHIETYLWLEQLRFENRLSVEYDIKTKDFILPPLLIQPIVENAVKHGILKKENGGTIKISTSESETDFLIIVEDNGVGFDITKNANDGDGVHIGMENVKQRLTNICHGNMKIKSIPGTGTTVTVTLPKKYCSNV